MNEQLKLGMESYLDLAKEIVAKFRSKDASTDLSSIELSGYIERHEAEVEFQEVLDSKTNTCRITTVIIDIKTAQLKSITSNILVIPQVTVNQSDNIC